MVSFLKHSWSTLARPGRFHLVSHQTGWSVSCLSENCAFFYLFLSERLGAKNMIELCGRPCVYCLYCVCCLYCAAGTYPDSGPAHWLAQITLQKPRYIQTGLPEPWQTSSACSSSWWWWSSRVHAYLVSDGDILMVVVAAVVGLHYLPSAFVIKGIWAELVTPHRADHIACWWWWRVSAYTPSALPQGWVVFCLFFLLVFFFLSLCGT